MESDRLFQGKSRGGAIGRLWLWLLCGCCMTAASAQGQEIVDLVGRRVQVPDDPRRIVTLAPGLTEMVYAIGQQWRLKGVSRFSDYPPAAEALPKVGSYIHPDLEKIVALKPDLCLAVKDGNPKEAVLRLEALGIPVYAVNPKSLEEVMETLLALGRLFHAEAQAEEAVASMRQRIEAVVERVSAVEERPRVFFQIGLSPIVSVGSQTFAHELVTLAGGLNVMEGPTSYPRLSVEEVMALRPDVIVVSTMSRGCRFQDIEALWRRWKGIPAVAADRIVLVDSDLFDRPSPRLVEGLERLADILHPEFPLSPST